MLTAHQAAGFLAEGCAITRRSARKVLDCGLAGPPVRTGRMALYEEERIVALMERTVLSDAELDALSPAGILLGRREVDVLAPSSAQLDEARAGWIMSVYDGVWLRHWVGLHGHVPFVVSVAGFVALGADVVDARRPAPGSLDLTLVPPGDWYASVRDRRVRSVPGCPWELRRPRVGQSGT